MIELPKWLRKFQRISWEPEILISGGILFTLFQAQSTLIQIKNYLYPLALQGLNPTLGFFTVGISALTIGFSFHLITKAFWIALLALKSVFPEGLNVTKLNYSEYFLKKESIDSSIDLTISKIGNTASLMFVVSFLFLLMSFGLGTYMILVSGLLFLLPLELLPFYIPISVFIFAPLIIPFIDFITFGSLKRGEISSKIYYPYYKIISWMTLSFLYRDILYTLISNIPKRRLVFFTLLFIIPTTILVYYNIAGFTHRSTAINRWSFWDDSAYNRSMVIRKYENLRNSDDPIVRGTIHGDVINEKHIKLYLRYQNWMDWQLKDLADSNPTFSDNQIINMYIAIEIDNISIDSVSWNYTRKMDINQFGIVGFIPIPNLEYGRHVIEVNTNEGFFLFTAPFWKE